MVACYKTEYTLSFCQELVGGPINSGMNELIVHTLHPGSTHRHSDEFTSYETCVTYGREYQCSDSKYG
jgi:hypothetical protein